MITDLNKIFELWKDKVGSKRTPNPKSAEHQYQLREILNDLNWDEEVITELIYNLTEKREPGDTWETASGWAGLKQGEDSARYGMDSEETADAYVRGEEEPEDEEEWTPDSEKPVTLEDGDRKKLKELESREDDLDDEEKKELK